MELKIVILNNVFMKDFILEVNINYELILLRNIDGVIIKNISYK